VTDVGSALTAKILKSNGQTVTIDTGFYGVGLPHIGVEALIAMTNKLLMHYRCSSATGRFIQISYSLLLVELGMSFQPLQVNYEKKSYLITHTWMKML
jgi:hypothetical protein